MLCRISETASQDDTGESVPEYGLYPEGSEQTRFSYAIFLLNKVRPARLSRKCSPVNPCFP